MHNGTTQTVEKAVNPESEYLKKVPEHLRTFEEVVNYAPNQTYIGNLTPEALGKLEKPWVGVDVPGSARFGKFGDEVRALLLVTTIGCVAGTAALALAGPGEIMLAV